MQKCPYSDIVSFASATKHKFIDMDFCPSIQINEDSYLLQDVKWIRIEEFYETSMLTEITPLNAIKQGKLGNCHIVSALIAISQYPNLVHSLFESPTSIDSGAVCTNFYYLGQNIKIVVDTLLPFKNGRLVFTRPQDKNHPWWFLIVEKAYAKLFGSFNSLIGGNSHAALFRLIGGWPLAFYFNDTETQELINNGKLFKRMRRWSREGYPMCCGSLESPYKPINLNSSESSPSIRKNKYNIRYDHAYAILKVVKIHSHKLIYLRNTWGKSEWSGRWGIDSKVWNEKIRYSKSGEKKNLKSLKEILEYNQKDDGNFWMNFADFVKYFSSLFVDVILKDYWKKTGVGGIWNEISEINENNENVDSPSQISIDPNSMHQWLLRFDKPLELKCTFEKVGEQVSCFALLIKNGGKKLGSFDQSKIESQKTNSFKVEEEDDSDDVDEKSDGQKSIESDLNKNEINLKDEDFFTQNFPKNSEVMSFRWDVEDVSEPWTLILCRQKCNKNTSFYLTIYTVDEIHISNL